MSLGGSLATHRDPRSSQIGGGGSGVGWGGTKKVQVVPNASPRRHSRTGVRRPLHPEDSDAFLNPLPLPSFWARSQGPRRVQEISGPTRRSWRTTAPGISPTPSPDHTGGGGLRGVLPRWSRGTTFHPPHDRTPSEGEDEIKDSYTTGVSSNREGLTTAVESARLISHYVPPVGVFLALSPAKPLWYPGNEENSTHESVLREGSPPPY